MKIAVFSTKPYDRQFLTEANGAFGHELYFLEARLSRETVALADGFAAICIFVNDMVDATVIDKLAAGGTRLIALRCAGFNNVDLKAARACGIEVVRVPAYSPYAVAEHTLGLLLSLNRKFHRAYNRVREGNFSLDGLLGFDIHGLTVGIIGTGQIGLRVAQLFQGFGCRLLAYDPYPAPEAETLGISYVSLDKLIVQSDIITLHCPLTPQTHHIIAEGTIAKMKQGVILLNTSRGALIDTPAVIAGLKSGKIAYLGIDVYEEEGDLFFEDLSNNVIQDDIFSRLQTFPNVLITGHQAFFTRDALKNIADTTLSNVSEYEKTGTCDHSVSSMMKP